LLFILIILVNVL